MAHDDRIKCTAENPYTKDKAGRWYHPDAEEVDEDYGKGGGVSDGDFVKYKCPHCNHSWWSELSN